LGIEDCKSGTKKYIVMVWTCSRKDDDDWVKECVTLEAEEARGRSRITWKEVVDKDLNDLH